MYSYSCLPILLSNLQKMITLISRTWKIAAGIQDTENNRSFGWIDFEISEKAIEDKSKRRVQRPQRELLECSKSNIIFVTIEAEHANNDIGTVYGIAWRARLIHWRYYRNQAAAQTRKPSPAAVRCYRLLITLILLLPLHSWTPQNKTIAHFHNIESARDYLWPTVLAECREKNKEN